MLRDYAIERTCSHRDEKFQLAFARKAMQMVQRQEDFAFEATRNGLTILAETEMALERPLSKLHDIYADALRVGPPVIRYRRGEIVEEPYMGLRVLCVPARFGAIKRDLLMREAAILDTELNDTFAVVRATAALARLIGYPTRVRDLTSEHVQLVMWLSHYAQVEPTFPGGGAA